MTGSDGEAQAGLPDAFERAVALWAIGLAGSDRVAAGAAELVAAGATTPALVDLAGRSRGENWFEMGDLIAQAFVETGRGPFDPKSTRLRHAAVADYAIDFLNGTRSAAETPALADRLYRADDPADATLSNLYLLDNEQSSRGSAAFDRRTRRAAHRFLTSFGAAPTPSIPAKPPEADLRGPNDVPRHREDVSPAAPSLADLKNRLDDLTARLSLRLMLVAVIAAIPISAAFCISELVTSQDPVYTGVFTREYVVEGRRNSIAEYGRFESSDGSVVVHDVRLVGASEPSGIVKVTYKPTGLGNDETTATVYTASRRETNSAVPWIVLVGSSVITGIVWKVWRAMRAEKAAELRAARETPSS